jgi:starch-binding outer membrane protein, SusD/RagB family
MKNQFIMKTKYILLLGLIVVLFYACQDDWLDPKPLSVYVPENVFVDKDGMESVLLVLRRGLRDEYYGNASRMCQEIAASDVGHFNGEQAVEIHDYITQLTPTSGGNANIFIWLLDPCLFNDKRCKCSSINRQGSRNK